MSHASRPERRLSARLASPALRRLLEIVAVGGGLLVIFTHVTGGATVWLGPVRLRAHDPTLLLSLAVAAGACAAALGGWRGLMADALTLRTTFLRWGGVALALGTLTVGVARGTFTAGGADSSGYLNEADLFASGRLTVDVPLARVAPWPHAAWLLTPFGFIPGLDPGTMVPTYAPGFPLTLAGAQSLGGRSASFLVVPTLGAVAVWLTFWLGRRVGGVGCGVCAATLLACSPIFLFQLVQPMSDVPTTAWWLAAIALGMRATVPASAAAGGAASLAVLTRPNLAPLVLLVGAYLGWHARTLSGHTKGLAPSRLVVWFCATSGLGLAATAAWQAYAYGSPVRSGYGTASELFSLAFVWTNLQRYPTWMFETHTPLVALALAAPLLARSTTSRDRVSQSVNGGAGVERAFSLFALAFAGAVFFAYLVYAPFDDWTFLRFLLPALPLVFVLVGLTVTRVLQWLPAPTRASVMVVGVAAVASLYLFVAGQRDVFRFRDHERRYRAVGEYLAARLPPDAIIVTVQHSGSARYYTGRPILRWDAIEPARLDDTLTWVREQGHRPFVVLERWEEEAFRERFAGASPIGGLDWPAMAQHHAGVAVYDPEHRAAFSAGRATATERIDDALSERGRSRRP